MFLGPDRKGWIRGCGFGVTQSQIDIMAEKSEKEAKMQEEIDLLKANQRHQDKLIESLMRKLVSTSKF